jgi:iterative type I PKS product template protein
LIKVLMMLKKNAIPANVGIKGIINQSFPKDLAQRNVHIPTTQTPYLRNGAEPRKLFLNNFSAAGGNTAIIIEDGPLRQAPESVDPRSTHLITVSARSIASLKRNIENIDDFLAKNPTATLPSLAYTTTARRIQHNYRVAFTMSDISNVRETLMAQMKDTYSPIAMVPTRVAFTFTGQGSQYTGLGKKLYEDLSSFRNDIHDLDRIAQLLGFPSFTPLLDGTDVTTLSPVVVQLGMSCIQVALARMWACWGITPIAVIGHSLGEYAALHVAGVLSASDMIFLVGRRAQLLEQDCTKYTHGMLAVKASVEAMEELLGDQMPEVACINGPEETVLCGTADVIARISDIVAPKGFKSTKLNVPFAFHSAQVDPILEAFKRAASSATFNKPAIPVLSPLTGDVIREAGVIGPDYLARHARETVNFWVALCQGVDEKIVDEKTAWLEVGAHPVCSGMVRSSLDSVPVTASSLRRGEDPWKTLTNSLCSLYLAGVAIDFNEFHREFSASHELLTLPTYSFDNKRYWLDYHNNWCLTKGEAPVVVEKALERVVEAPSKLSTTSCQKIVHEQLHANSGTVVIRSNMAEPKLHKVIAGHKLNGSPLCPSSLYADMAMTVADYLYKQLRPAGEPVGYNVCQMEVHKPLVPIMPPPAEGQWLEMEANADLDNNSIHLKFRTVTPTGELLQDHGHGLVRLENSANWIQDWSRTQFMVQSQVDLLKQKLEVGAAHKILRGMAYKLFKVLVDYDTPYRGMEEVILDGQQAEATAKVRFQNTEQDGDFFCAPFWIDSLAHISGFIVNATDTVGSDLIYISHGWEAIRIAKPLSSEKTYRSYVRMLPAPRNIFAGDVYIFDGEDIIGVVQGLKFQGVTQKVFNIMVPPAKQATAAPTKSAPAITAPIAKIPVSKQEVASVVSMPRSSVIARVSEAKLEKAKKVKSSPFAGSITSRVMKIIAEETDVDMSELVDEAAFENLGVDSLMSLTISAKFREDLNMEISSTLFTDNPTVGEMKKFFGQYDGAASLSDSDDSASEVSSDVASHDDDVSTPASSAPSTAPSVCDKEEIIKPVSHATSASVSGPSIARQIIAEEMGVSTSEIADTADLAEMGMDSLMSLAILGSLREKTGIDLPSTFLMTNSTMEDIENALGMRPKPQQQSSAKAVSRPRRPQLEQVNQKLAASKPKIDVTGLPPANSVLLQGNARVATKKLFLVPDGSGSATSYVSIPNISSDVAVYGLNCPFMKQPKDWTCGVEGVSALYLNEIRRRQPSGPYMVGGWSAGGVFAYEVTCQLLAQGEQVERLVLIDAPCPVSLEPLPARLHVFFDQIGLLGTGKAGGTPSWLLPHFAATIQALSDYEPTPMAPGRAPPTTAIWCSDGVCPNPGDPRPPAAEGEDPAPMKWLLNNRTDFGDNGWGQLLPGAMEFAVMGGNHFTMMKEPHVSRSL